MKQPKYRYIVCWIGPPHPCGNRYFTSEKLARKYKKELESAGTYGHYELLKVTYERLK